ncbi:MAG: FkbM family methyltransferase [Pseudomonadota bacterium]
MTDPLLQTDLYTLVKGRHGHFLTNPQDVYMGRSILNYGEFSEAEWQLLDQITLPGMSVVEAGANMGTLTVPLANKLGRKGMLYAFEPQIAIFQLLCANLALNDLVNVQAFNAGCGEQPEWLPIIRLDPAKQRNFGGIGLEHLTRETNTRVRIEALDDALDMPALHLIKADVEGMEVPVLKGAAGLIGKHRPLLYLEASKEHAPEIISHVLGLDYEMWWHLPPMFNPQNFFGKAENLYGRITSKNVVCAPVERKFTVKGLRKVTGPEDHPSNWGR